MKIPEGPHPLGGKTWGLDRMSRCMGAVKRAKRGHITLCLEDCELILDMVKEIRRREILRLAQRRRRSKPLAIRQPGSILAPHQSIKPNIT